jgi:hypothetical protein
MPNLTHVTVTAPEGKRTPIHPDDGVEPGGAQLHVVAPNVYRVRYSQAIRRACGRGDLIPCDANGAPVASLELAAAPDDLKAGKAKP